MAAGKARRSGDGSAMRLRRPVVLVGMMGSGKTAIGRALSARLGCGFVDSDTAIEEAAKCSIAEIFARDGEAFFRARESEVLERLLEAGPRVVSTGGGAFLAPRNRDAIAARGAALWLDADLDLLWERVRHKSTRPLLRTPDPRGTLSRLLDERRPIYAEAPMRLVARPGDSIEATTDRVIETLAQRPDILETRP
ncbi:shikimate kinase [Limimaricola soesokkakensis]|uniref:Shikimate kinase n=1 Tax=Limimaricola soesokkakensis TaxID=1343159 RepID=A0A1X6ZX00_9RHOB|nr:shikimate kinase [Limimaricola soesokkakensis]PSK83485.1 shikimate kinase [Limimaricola soesokkakensis]SLN64080.1 Shikimate kinase 1 [Limimaricola soesokkakensis]